jgi:hypothetical protein
MGAVLCSKVCSVFMSRVLAGATAAAEDCKIPAGGSVVPPSSLHDSTETHGQGVREASVYVLPDDETVPVQLKSYENVAFEGSQWEDCIFFLSMNMLSSVISGYFVLIPQTSNDHETSRSVSYYRCVYFDWYLTTSSYEYYICSTVF